MRYRAEIDGLRAVAVIPIILFHAGFEIFSGGFVGVDIFFVISGYLITTILLSEMDEGRFSLLSFYERRARRILPALFFVMAVCIPFAWFLLIPTDAKSFSQSLIAVSLFSSNIFFWKTSGYFDSSAELKPLLHTWSLSVEEQYYVIFPTILMLLWRMGRYWAVSLLTALALVSLLTAQWFIESKPWAAFYLLPTRGWELLIGSLAALYLLKKHHGNQNALARELGSIVGFLLILYATFVFNKRTPFPSFYTLVPTLGAGLIIIFASGSTIVARLLGSRLFVGIGLISYSAYLWHQPLFAFARHYNLGKPSAHVIFVLILAVGVLSFLSWKYIETPFRSKSLFTRRKIFIFGVFGSALFVFIGLAGHYTKGFENRIFGKRADFLKHFKNTPPEKKYFFSEGLLDKNRYQCDFYNISKSWQGYPTNVPIDSIPKECYERNPDFNKSVFIWGDSHARHLYFGLAKTLPGNWQILQVTSSGCAPKLNAKKSAENYCEYSNWFAYKAIIDAKPDVVIVGQNKQSIDKMIAISENLRGVGVKKVIFTGPTPHWKAALPKIIVNRLWDETSRRTFIGLDTEFIKLDESLKNGFPVSKFAEYVSVIDYFCNESGCILYFGDDRTVGLTSWDYGHLTPIASYHFAKDVLANKVMDILK